MILGVILVLSGYYTWDNFAKLIKSGFSSTGPTAALFVFSVLYFGIMTDAGMFDVIINFLMKFVKDNVIGVCLMTAIIAMIGHLDGAGAATFCIVIPALPIAAAMAVCRNCATFISPMVPATLLGVGLADVDINQHIKSNFLWVWGFSFICMIAAILFGIIPV